MGVWRSIPGFENIYEVSNTGKIKSLARTVYSSYRGKPRTLQTKEKILSPTPNKHGYLCVNLYKHGNKHPKFVHKIVAQVFLNHIPCGHKLVVDHIDNNKNNNSADNLQIVTQRFNVSKNSNAKTSKYVGVSWNSQKNKWRSRIYIDGKNIELGLFESETDAAKAYKEKLKQINYA